MHQLHQRSPLLRLHPYLRYRVYQGQPCTKDGSGTERVYARGYESTQYMLDFVRFCRPQAK